MRPLQHVAFLVIVCAAGTAAAAPPFFAVQLHSLQGPSDNHRLAVDLCKQAGIGLVRDECHWHRIEQVTGEIIVPDVVKANVAYTVQQGLELLLLLNYGNDLYNGGRSPSNEASRAAFVRYVETVVGTFKGQVRFYEVWNEPNLSLFWRPLPDVEQYVLLLRDVYAACKRVDPDCFVVGGVVSAIDDAFLEGMFRRGALEWMDALSIHPYLTPKSPEQMQLVLAIRRRVYERMARFGTPRPIWITEIGWPTDLVVGVDYARQADMLTRTYLLGSTLPFLDVLGWYWFGEDDPTARTDPEKNYGLFYAGMVPKPAWLALDQIRAHLGPRPRGEEIPLPAPLHSVRFGPLDNARVAIWSASETTTVWLPVESGFRGEYLGAQGAARGLFPDVRETCRPRLTITVEQARQLRPAPVSFVPCLGGVCLSLGESPILIEGQGVESLIRSLAAHPVQIELPEIVVVRAGETTFRLDPAAIVSQGFQMPIAFPEAMRTRTMLRPVDVPAGISLRGTPDDSVIVLCATDVVPMRGHLWLEAMHDGRPWARLALPIEVREPAELMVSPATAVRTPVPGGVRVQVANTSPARLCGELTLHSKTNAFVPGSLPVDLPEAGTGEYAFQVRMPVVCDDVLDVTAVLTLASGVVLHRADRLSYTISLAATRAIQVDGALDDWTAPLRGAIRLGLPAQLVHAELSRTNPDACSARIYTCWDADYLYIAADVVDDIISGPSTGDSVYKNDGIEVYLDLDHDGDRDEAAYSEDDFQYGFLWSRGTGIAWRWSPVPGPSPAAMVSAATTVDGYVIEAAIPWQELGVVPEAGLHLGFNVALNDDDNPLAEDSFGQERQWVWTRTPGAWRDPRTFADLFLLE